MARKLRGLERVLDAPSLFAVAYGEIASSLYIALGIVAGAALGLTPLVLLVTGAVFVLVSLSYAEGTTALPETGGAATFVRRAFNDLAGFVTGWVLFLDFLIVMALSALFVPHYLAAALGEPSLREAPWDAVIGCAVIVAHRGRAASSGERASISARSSSRCSTCSCRRVLVLLGLALLLSPETLDEGFGFASGQDWSDLAFALPLAMLAYTGLETVANLAEEATRAGSHAAALALLRDRAGRRRDGADRRDRTVGVSGRRRPDGARGGVARGAARRDRGGVRRLAPVERSSTCSRSRSASRAS